MDRRARGGQGVLDAQEGRRTQDAWRLQRRVKRKLLRVLVQGLRTHAHTAPCRRPRPANPSSHSLSSASCVVMHQPTASAASWKAMRKASPCAADTAHVG